MSLIEININNSFNKEDNGTNKEKIVGDNSTFNKNLGNSIETNSINVASLTNSAVSNQSSFTIRDKHKTLIQEILIGAAGSVIGSIITLMIMKFWR